MDLAEIIDNPDNTPLKTRVGRFRILRNGYESKFAETLRLASDVEHSRVEMLKALSMLAKEYLEKARYYEGKYHGILYTIARTNFSDK